MRGNSRPQFQKAVDGAVRLALNAIHRAGFSAAPFGASTPPQFTTTEGVNDDGTIYTKHTAFTEIDNTEDPGALTTS